VYFMGRVKLPFIAPAMIRRISPNAGFCMCLPRAPGPEDYAARAVGGETITRLGV
jgi:hypothetical protein